MSDLGRAVAQPFPRLILPSCATRASNSRVVDAEHQRLDDLEPLLAALPAMERAAAWRILRELRALVRKPGR